VLVEVWCFVCVFSSYREGFLGTILALMWMAKLKVVLLTGGCGNRFVRVGLELGDRFIFSFILFF
jgi:hypothetical protein